MAALPKDTILNHVAAQLKTVENPTARAVDCLKFAANL